MSEPFVCRECSAETPADAFALALKVCPSCGFHHILNARERLSLIADPGTFEPFDEDIYSVDFLKFPGYAEKLRADRKKTSMPSEMLTGFTAIGGNALAIGITDANFIIGSMGSVVGEKIARCFERAIAEQLPVLIVSASGGGARMQEGTVALMQMAKTSAAVMKHHRAGLFYISLVTHPTMGGTAASFVSLGHVIYAEPGAMMGFAGPRARAAIGEKMPPKLQSSESLLEHGMLDMVVHRAQLRDVLSETLDFVYDRPSRRTQSR